MRLRSVLLLFPLLASADVLTYQIQPRLGSRFALQVEKTGLLAGKKHLFLFERYRGKLSYDRQRPENSRVEMIIEGASAVCQDTWVKPKELEKIQKTALDEMMEVEKHPRLIFSSTRITRTGENRFNVEGSLSIRGVSKPVTISVALDSQSGDVLTFSGRAQVKLKDYGLKPPSAALGLVGTKNEMQVDFALAAAADGSSGSPGLR